MPAENHAAAAAAPQPSSETGHGLWEGLDPAACAGVDEVGRGCLFGPVMAAAVVLPPTALAPLATAGLTDSKKLSPRRRAALVPLIRSQALACALGQASAAEIDRLGIRAATERAMIRSLQRLPSTPLLVLVDGNLPLRGWHAPQRSLIGGDSACLAIAAASVLAKEQRDALIRRLAPRFPGYGLERHVGYGTAEHLKALEALGASPLHRRSFLGGRGAAARSSRHRGR
ncbi:MAG: ribonuclease HII [Vulcanococcus sp.]